MTPLPIKQLIITVCESIATVVLLSLVGYLLARKGIIDDRMKKGLNKINVSLFTPALLFSKVAFTLTPKKLGELGIVPIGFVVVSGVSCFVAWTLGHVFRLNPSQRSFAMACAMFGNSNSLPIALVQSLVLTVPGLKWIGSDGKRDEMDLDDDNPDQMMGRALSYLVLYSTLGIILRWSVGVRLLRAAGDGPESGGGDAQGRPDGSAVSATEVERGNQMGDDGTNPRKGETREAVDIETSTSQIESTIKFGNHSPRIIARSPSPIDADKTTEREPLLQRQEASEDEGEEDAEATVVESPNQRFSRASTVDGNGPIGPVGPKGGTPEGSRRKRRPREPPTLASRLFHSFPNTPAPSTAGDTSSCFTSESESQTNSSSSSSGESDSDDENQDEEDPEWGVPKSRRRLAPGNPFSSDISDDGPRRRRLPGGSQKTRKRTTGQKWKDFTSSLRQKYTSFQQWVSKWIVGPGRKLWAAINDFMTVPLWAALLSIIVACISPVQSFLDDLLPLKDAIRQAGNCSVPVTLVTLGAYFYRPKPSSQVQNSTSPHPPRNHSRSHSRPPRRPSLPSKTSSWKAITRRPRLSFALPRRRFPAVSPVFESGAGDQTMPLRQESSASVRERRGERRTIFVSIMTRMILTPLILLPLFGWYASVTVNVADDPMFVLVAALLVGAPPAITLAQITSAASGEEFERLISKTLFVSYSLITPPTTIALVMAALYIDKFQ